MTGRVALVTGGGRNIGRAICLALAHAGADVVVNFNTAEVEATAVAAEVRGQGMRAMPVKADISEPAQVERMFTEAIDAMGGVDILVNNSAVRPQTAFLEMTAEEWRWVLGVGLDGAFYCARAAAPGMVARRWGRIVNVSGPDGFAGRRNRAHGVTVKAGIHGLTKALALELAEHSIRVNTLVPSTVDTVRRSDWYPDFDRDEAELMASVPLGRRSTVSEVAEACLFLVSDQSSYITGQALHVNGGRYLH